MGSCISMLPDPLSDESSAPKRTDQLSLSGYIPNAMSWFPSEKAHRNIKQLFTKKKNIASGSFSLVFSAKYKGKLCAVKQIKRDEVGQMQFITEAKVLSILNHDGIINCIDMLMDENYFYLVLEKADYSLRTVLNHEKCLSEFKTKKLIYALLNTIAYIHHKNLIHRDLKPANIIFTKLDPNLPKLIDFGDAEMAKPGKTYTEFVGTPNYMSPERLTEHNCEELKKSDIWAIGAITFEMFTGNSCFIGNTQKEIFAKVLNGQWQWNPDRKPSVDMHDFIKGCLDMNVRERFSVDVALKHPWFVNTKEMQ